MICYFRILPYLLSSYMPYAPCSECDDHSSFIKGWHISQRFRFSWFSSSLFFSDILFLVPRRVSSLYAYPIHCVRFARLCLWALAWASRTPTAWRGSWPTATPGCQASSSPSSTKKRTPRYGSLPERIQDWMIYWGPIFLEWLYARPPPPPPIFR